MRRSLMILTVLAASVVMLGACDPKPEVPNKPGSTPTPTATASPVVSPTVSPSPTASPGRPAREARYLPNR
ncbi:MAG: hypothetical protein ABR530_00075 [Pyrinomonadaceae bacterium]